MPDELPLLHPASDSVAKILIIQIVVYLKYVKKEKKTEIPLPDNRG